MKAILKTPQKRTAQMKKVIIKEYPELEDLVATPSAEEQIFKSTKYGYGEVKVNAVPTEEITITPSANEQVFEGMFNKVTVEGDEDLKPENIKRGTTLFGVEGTMDAAWDTSQMRSCYKMFRNNTDMVEPPEMDTSNVTDMSYMHYDNSNLLRGGDYNTINVTDMSYMHYSNSNLVECGKYDTSNVTTMSSMHYRNDNLVNGGNYNTPNVKSFNDMYYRCENLKNVPAYRADSTNNVSNMLNRCSELENFDGLINLGKGYTQKSNNYAVYSFILGNSSKLTHTSLINIINNLYDLNLTYDVANGGTLYTQKLTLGPTNITKLTAEEIQIAVQKGWTVS